MQYRSTNPEGKARGMSVSILYIQSEGLVNNCFLPHCFLGINMLLAPKNCMNVCHRPQELYSSKHMGMNSTRRDCITYTVPCIP